MKLNVENHVISLLNRTRGQATKYIWIGTYEQNDINSCFEKN